MVRKYTWLRKDGYSQSIGLTKLMALAALRVIAGAGPFNLSQDGDPIAVEKSRADVLKRFKVAISQREIGSVFRIRRANNNVVFTARATRELDYSTADSTNGNDNSDIYYNWVKARFQAYKPRYAGSYVCKTISGSWNLSQHSYGNAVDFFFDTTAHQDAVYQAVKHGDCPVPVAHAISQRNIWEPGSGEHYYSGDYHSHLHVDFFPQYSGACGVRG